MSKKQPIRTAEEQKKYLSDMIFSKHYAMTWRVFVVTAGSLAICGGIGYGLDLLLATRPVLLIIGLVASFPVAQIMNVLVFTKLTQKSSS